MMVYFDTSFLTPLILQEATSERVESFVGKLTRAKLDLCIGHWVRVEFASLLAREVRIGGLAKADAWKAAAQFDQMVADSYEAIAPLPADFDLAKQYIEKFDTGLRAGDAIHLAVAKNRGAKTLYTLDRTLLKAAKLLGIPASSGIKV